jgi:glutathione S-transferase
MAQYIDVEEAIGMSGLRVVLTPSVPGPWTEAAKAILRVKKLPYLKVRQELMGENLPLLKWTKQATAPVFVYNDERPRSIWNDQLYLAERLQPNPPLIPADIVERMLMFGSPTELCGGNSLALGATPDDHPFVAQRHQRQRGREKRYAFSGREVRLLRAKRNSRAGTKSRGNPHDLQSPARSATQAGQPLLVGDHLSAVDLYWAAFAALIQPLPDDLCKMPSGFARCTIARMRS